jgi:hypothetical protein
MCEVEARSRSMGLQLESDDRVHTFRPDLDVPGLHDALVGNDFDIASRDGAAKASEHAACRSISAGAPVKALNRFASSSAS